MELQHITSDAVVEKPSETNPAQQATKHIKVSTADTGVKPRVLPQLIASCIANLVAMSLGLSMGYSSPAAPDLERVGLLTSKNQVAWFGSLLALGGILGGPIAGIVVDKMGRKSALMMCNVPYAFGWILIIAAQNHVWLYIGRFICGIGAGMSTVAAPVYVTEVAAAYMRGLLGNAFQVFLIFGLITSFGMGIILDYQWLGVICACVPPISCLATLAVPETPRWLINVGALEAGQESLTWLRGRHYNIESEYIDIRSATQESRNKNKETISIRELLSDKQFRNPMVLSASLFVFLHASGATTSLFYTVDIFTSAGITGNPYVFSLIVVCVELGSASIASFLIDVAGRRVLLIVTGSLMTLGSLLLGVHFYMKIVHETVIAGWLPLLCLIILEIPFTFGWGPVPAIVMGELVPLRARGLASSIINATAWLVLFLITFQFYNMQVAMTPYGTFWFFASCSFIGVLVVAFFLPETKRKPLEEIKM